jgi:hypothetical protein
MTAERRYCLNTNILSVHTTKEGRKEPIYVPAGAVVEVDDLVPTEGPLVKVVWEAKTVLMFLQDIVERAQPLPPPGYCGLPQMLPLAC